MCGERGERRHALSGLEAAVKRFLFCFSLRPFHFPSSPPLPPLSSSVLLSFFSYHHSLIAFFLTSCPMKALFNRFNRGLSKDKAKDSKDTDVFPPSSSYQKEKLPQLPPLKDWPPQLEQPQRSVGTPTSITSFKPLPELSSRPLPPIGDVPVPPEDYFPISVAHSRGPLSDVAEEESIDITVVTRTTSPRADQDSAGRSSRKTGNSISTTNGNSDVQKKVAFISPAPTPTPSNLGLDHPLADDASVTNKSTIVRSPPTNPREPRGSTSTAASSSRTDIGSSKSTQTVKATTTRSAPSPYPTKPGYGDGVSIHQSLRSGTPFSQKSTGSVLPPASWSEGAEEDLVTHLGPRERTRQEVLWEIVASEER
jgi:hypothetical protein